MINPYSSIAAWQIEVLLELRPFQCLNRHIFTPCLHYYFIIGIIVYRISTCLLNIIPTLLRLHHRRKMYCTDSSSDRSSFCFNEPNSSFNLFEQIIFTIRLFLPDSLHHHLWQQFSTLAVAAPGRAD